MEEGIAHSESLNPEGGFTRLLPFHRRQWGAAAREVKFQISQIPDNKLRAKQEHSTRIVKSLGDRRTIYGLVISRHFLCVLCVLRGKSP
jgi:hypothetical protein